MNALVAAELRFAALYESDARGRLLRCANTDVDEPEVAPRFHLLRTVLGNVWRFRFDLAPPLVKRLATLAGKEAALANSSASTEPAPPEREEFIRRALEAEAPIEAGWAGPAYAFPDRLAPVGFAGQVRELRAADRAALHPELSDAVLGEASRGIVVGGEVVALCSSVRGTAGTALEAGVRTASGFERRGYATAAVSAWAAAVRASGGEPIYSTSWENRASRAVAEQLGLLFIGEERHWR